MKSFSIVAYSQALEADMGTQMYILLFWGLGGDWVSALGFASWMYGKD